MAYFYRFPENLEVRDRRSKQKGIIIPPPLLTSSLKETRWLAITLYRGIPVTPNRQSCKVPPEPVALFDATEKG